MSISKIDNNNGHDDWVKIPVPRNSASLFYTIKCALNTVAAWFELRNMGSQLKSGFLIRFLTYVIGDRDISLIARGAFDGHVNVDNLKLDKTLVIPVLVKGIVGNHMTLLYLEKTAEGYNVEFYDGKALPITHPLNANANEIYTKIKKKSKVASFKQLEKPLQFDAHSCGVLAAWFLEKRLNGSAFEAIASLNPHAIIETYREKLIQRSQ